MAAIQFDGVSKVYGDGTCAVDALDLEIQEGEFMVFVGPSGCGKTTALRMVAGLEDISAGQVVIGGKAVNDVSPKDRDIAMVFQNYALYPHMTVAQNLAFGLKLRKITSAEVERRVRDAAVALDLEDYLERKPKALSGGQRQRVALGRAIVREPAAFLMDEPLSNLDAALRVQTRAEILKLQKRLGTTTIYVTHDQVEAMTMGDRIAVMRKGILQQIGTPEELYTRPANTFVATFIGSPAMNVVPAPVLGLGSDTLLAGFRPEHISVGQPQPGHFGFEAVVEVVEYLGDERLAHVRLGERALVGKIPADEHLTLGTTVAFAVPREALIFFDAETGLASDRPS
ncbi:MAG TPA: ATP-binding cassette domain-containing protein [Solirubrobacteraceae bacterium]|jgi:ABC-type sugar transport system ATPase subunit|nr:ATP-binding cassette domain-containing protein [Solirubrobacteraceae bacterium]